MTKRQKYEILRGALELERSSFVGHWRELGEHILPRRPRFYTMDVDRGDRRNNKIIDSTATLAARTLRSGLMSGITSPARPWFRLTTSDPGLAENGSVKEWLDIVTNRMAEIFLRSNLYNSLPVIYGDIGTFATAALMVEEDFDSVIRTYPFPIGSYMIANSDKLKVEVFFREFRLTVRQCVEKFGNKNAKGEIDWSNFSQQIQQMWKDGKRDIWIDVCHVIMPNDEYDPDRVEAKFKRFTSCYYERGITGNGSYTIPMGDLYLRESGYDLFPVLCPRWEVTGEDVYGTECPGMTALGDIKQLQLGEKRGMQAIEKMVSPPMNAAESMRTRKASVLPGDITFVPGMTAKDAFVPAYQIDPRINELEAKQAQVRERVQRAFYEDLFLMLSQSDRREITAREVDERHEEKLLALGPVLEQLNQDLLDPLVDIAFEIGNRQGRFPPPPQELQGQPIHVEYVSIMAQAQKLLGLGGLERFSGFVQAVAAVDPSILDKVNGDRLVESYGDQASIPPGIVRDDEEVAALRESRQKAQQAQTMMENAKNMAGAAKDLSETDTTKDNALTQLLKQGQAGQIAPQQ